MSRGVLQDTFPSLKGYLQRKATKFAVTNLEIQKIEGRHDRNVQDIKKYDATVTGFLHKQHCGATVLASPQYASDTFGVLSLTWITKRHKLSE